MNMSAVGRLVSHAVEAAGNYKWGLYHRDNSDKWIYEILNKVKFKIIESEKNIENNDILIIVDSSIEKKREFYSNLRLVCAKIFLFHLGDESGAHDLSSIYKNCTHIWRAFCSNKYFNNDLPTPLP